MEKLDNNWKPMLSRDCCTFIFTFLRHQLSQSYFSPVSFTDVSILSSLTIWLLSWPSLFTGALAHVADAVLSGIRKSTWVASNFNTSALLIVSQCDVIITLTPFILMSVRIGLFCITKELNEMFRYGMFLRMCLCLLRATRCFTIPPTPTHRLFALRVWPSSAWRGYVTSLPYNICKHSRLYLIWLP